VNRGLRARHDDDLLGPAFDARLASEMGGDCGTQFEPTGVVAVFECVSGMRAQRRA